MGSCARDAVNFQDWRQGGQRCVDTEAILWALGESESPNLLPCLACPRLVMTQEAGLRPAPWEPPRHWL